MCYTSIVQWKPHRPFGIPSRSFGRKPRGRSAQHGTTRATTTEAWLACSSTANTHSQAVAHGIWQSGTLTLVHDTLELSQQQVQADATQGGMRARCLMTTRMHHARHWARSQTNLRGVSRNECVSAQGNTSAPPTARCAWVFRCTSNLKTLIRGPAVNPLSCAQLVDT